MKRYPVSYNTRLKIDCNERPTAVHELARVLTSQNFFAKDEGGRLYFYEGGVYRPRGELFVAELVHQILDHCNRAGKWSPSLAERVTEFIRTEAPYLREKPALWHVNVQNGIIDCRTRQIQAHTPEYLSIVQLPVTCDSHAECPAWDKFISETFPEDAQGVAYEIVAWLMLPHMEIQKALLLLGEGANGKSTLLRALRVFLGNTNVSALSLHSLESNRFATSRLLGKLANICPDIADKKLTTTSTFKAITGGDAIVAEYKHRDSFDFTPFCRLVFSANEFPRSDDSSAGWYRRFLPLRFENQFPENPEVARQLDAALAQPNELSGVLNKALAAVPHVLTKGISITPSMKQCADEFRAVTDPLIKFLATDTEEHPDGWIPKDMLREAYNLSRNITISPEAFGRAMKKAKPGIIETQRTLAERKIRGYSGVQFREDSVFANSQVHVFPR